MLIYTLPRKILERKRLMAEPFDPAAPEAGHEFTMTRIFDAPREVVYRLWTDPEHFAQWFGPASFTVPVCEMDARPGGTLLIHMLGSSGAVCPNMGVFHEVVEPERLVFTTGAIENEAGVPQIESHNTVTFSEHNGQTHVTLHVVVSRTTPDADEALTWIESGWSQSLDRITAYLMQS